MKIKNLKIKKDNMDLDLSFNGLNLYVGKNGSGKSFVNKCTWFASFSAGVISTSIEEKVSSSIIEQGLTNCFRKTFFESSEMDIELDIEFTNDENLRIYYSNDKLTYICSETFSVEYSKPLYLSTDTRLFKGIESVAKIDLEQYILSEDRLEDLDYPFYDVLYVNFLKQHIEGGYTFDKQQVDMFKEHYEVDFVSIRSEDNKFYLTDSTGKERRCSSLSNGEQSLLSMFLGVSITN